jgi:serine/threonine-protein kinase
MKCPKCDTDNTDAARFCSNCATSLIGAEEAQPLPTQTIEAPREELTTGSTFAGRYQIIEELGKGGMGKVYKAVDTRINEKIALKLIKPEISSDKKTLERFGNELKLARKITHKNVGKMFDINEEQGTHYITMEYVSGQDLKGFIRQSGQMGIGTAISIAKQICEGLSEAHKVGVVHRDLKPNNIMIDREGEVRIMDFGIARSLKEKGITGAGVMIGTPEYMSPEQAEAKEVDQRADIYSLGVILYEMVTGRVPFEGDTALSIAMKHKGESPKDPKEYNAQIPDDLSRLVLKCLEKDRDKRYQSAGELFSELNNIEKGIPTTDRGIPKRKPITSKEITLSFSAKKLVIPVLAVIAITIVGLFLWHPWSRTTAPLEQSDKPSIAVLPFDDFSAQKDQEYFCDGMTDELIAKLSKLKALRVIPRTSMMRYKNTKKDIKEISRELMVTSILEGSVRKEEEDIRVIATLINVSDNSQIWSETYDRRLESVFVIQSNIAEAISNALLAKLSADEKVKLLKNPTDNLDAYNLYLQGRFFWNKRTKEGLNKALEYFKQAAEEDPTYALAHAGMADVYSMLASYNILHPRQAYSQSKASSIRALELDENLAEAFSSLAWAKLHLDLDWAGSESDYKRAISLNPNYETAHLWYSSRLFREARWKEAFVEQQKAQEIDPFSLAIRAMKAALYYFARDYDKAIEYSNKTIEMDPTFHWAHTILGDAYIQKSMFKEAVEEKKKAANLSGSSKDRLELAYAQGSSGNRKEAIRILGDLLNRKSYEYVPLSEIASVYVSLGETDEAFKYIQKAIEEKEITWNLLNLKVDPKMDSLRSDPRFADLLKKIGLE